MARMVVDTAVISEPAGTTTREGAMRHEPGPRRRAYQNDNNDGILA